VEGPTGSQGCPSPEDEEPIVDVRAIDVAEAHLTDPCFNRGASVKLAPISDRHWNALRESV